MFNGVKRMVVLLLISLLGAASPLLAGSMERISRDTRWSGEVTLSGPVQVDKGARLTIAAGSTVRAELPNSKLLVLGKLVVAGSSQQPVRFETVSGWEGIEFIEAEQGSEIRHADFNGAHQAVSLIAASPRIVESEFRNCKIALRLLREATPLIENNRFIDNEIGVDNEMRSAPTIRGNRFEKHSVSAIVASNSARGLIEDNRFDNNKQGVGIVQPYPDPLRGNRFVGNETALYCSQTKNTPLIEKNLFEKNGKGVVNYSFAYPAIEHNRFIDNDEAIRNDQFGSAKISHNLIRGSKTALYLNRKSNPQIEYNLISGNQLAMFVDYSSYPRVTNNHFFDNGMAVKLGIYQSADWEKRSGSKRLVQQEASARRSKNPLLAQAPENFNDYVDVSGNWWGEQSADLQKVGPDADLAMFHDRRDQPMVSYPGFGEGSYALDVIRYAPWLTQPVPEVGP
ncbi:MAG: hypothetical protein C0624_09910 [Desulfuromonas sp.]|nr:MAG: hypothetical protein C0624_09910 [Desulfuromonas sp.]